MAADMVADGMGYGSVGEMAAQADHTVFGAVMFVMSICILACIPLCILCAWVLYRMGQIRVVHLPQGGDR